MASSTIEEAKLPGGYLVTPRVPQGLAAAVEGLTREVIRNSPEDIYVFAAHHFEKLLQLREECGVVGGGRGGEKSPNIECRTNNTLMEMSRALRMREIDREHSRTTRNMIDQVGWSLNQTAKVLKRHRSIFGEEGRRITTDEVFLMANKKENDYDSPKSVKKKLSVKKSGETKKSDTKSNDLWKASTSRTEHSLSTEDSPDNVDVSNAEKVRAGPKIMTQMSSLSSGNIMLAKDIKTELRKNRISSKERRNLRGRQEEKNVQEKSDNKLFKSSIKSSSKKSTEKQKKIEGESGDKRSRKNNDLTRSSRDRNEEKSRGQDSSRNNEERLKKRAPSMDRVKDYVIDKFATTRSLEELQSVNYVEKVQEIIDETGPIITEKIEQLKSGVIGRSERSSWFANARGNRVKESNEESTSEKSRLKEISGEISASESSTSDALRTRLTETKKLMENISSSIGRPSRRSRSARSFRRSIENLELCDDELYSRNSLIDTPENSNNILEAKLAKTRNLMEGISSSLTKPMRRSSSAKNLRKCQEPLEEGNRDALKKRLDETRNLLRGISASFGNSLEKSFDKTAIDPQDSTFSEDQMTSKSSLPAVRSISLRNSSGSVSRSDSDNLVLPAISPEAPKSSKIKEDLILPVLSPPATASTNEDSCKILDSNDDVPLKDFGIPEEMPVEDFVSELPMENLSRDSLNVTPDFDSVPQRPDSLEPVNDLEGNNLDDGKLQQKVTTSDDLGNEALEANDLETTLNITDGLEAKTLENKDVEKEIGASGDSGNETPQADDLEAPLDITGDLETQTLEDKDCENETPASKDLRTEVSEANDLQPQLLEVDVLEKKPLEIVDPLTEISDATGLEETKVTPDDLKSRLQEIQQVQKSIEEALEQKTTISTEKPEGFDMIEKLREVEEAEKRIDKIFDTENRAANEDGEKSDKTPGEIVDESSESGEKVQEEISTEKIETKCKESDEVEKEKELDLEVQGSEKLSDKLENISPEPLDYTYVLTEGSPYEIPDTVTTVIIPERRIESPLSDRLNVEIEDETNVKLSLIPGEKSRKASIEEVVETETDLTDANVMNPEVEEEKVHSKEEKSTKESIEKTGASSKETSEKNTSETADEDEASPKSLSDPFGEFVKPETITETSPEIEFMREIKDLQIPHQDLGPINEEVSEELEDLMDKQEAMETLRNIEKLEEDEKVISLEVEEIDESKREKNEVKKNFMTVEESKVVESDLSPEATRPNVDSESSNEAKESSAVDGPLESGKCDNSMEEEEVSSETRTPESSNEIKETTLTDALSLSLDPTRPFVPELNLDSLQDITVSSFKMTEDDFEIQERGETENTNSITETLTSDENNRNNGEFVEEPVIENLTPSSSGSKVVTHEGEEIVEEKIVKSQVEIKEDICEKTTAYVTGPGGEENKVQEDETQFLKMEKVEETETGQIEESELKTEEKNTLVEAKEETVIAEPNKQENEETVKTERDDHLKEIEKNLPAVSEDQKIVEIETKDESIEIKSDDVQIVKMEESDETVSKESEQEPTNPENFIENVENVEILQKEKMESKKVDEILQTEDSKENENTETVNSQKGDNKSELDRKIKEEPNSSLSIENFEAEDTKFDENVDRSIKEEVNVESEKIDVKNAEEIDILKKEEIDDEEKEKIDFQQNEEINTHKIEEIVTPTSQEIEKGEIDIEKDEEIDTDEKEEIDIEEKEEIDSVKKEEIVEGLKNNNVSKEEEVSENCVEKKVKGSIELVKEENLNNELEADGEDADDVLEESFVEEETPLAVSRSASQCTTRRVSSGNLAKLREDPTLSWTEEIEHENEKSENDQSSTKVTFLGINDETTNEKASKENDGNVVSPNDVSDEITESQTTKDKEYHIYVPEVDASEDNSTTESSTFDSAVTKIQAGVRGFLTRRRLLRGLQNRSSTLSGIPSIQDSIAIESDGVDDRVLEASEEKIPRPEETSISSPKPLDDDLVDAATRIQNNYRRYKARKRLKREDAVQRTTFSLEKSFAESGLQHTGEFHDCIPLPIHDITIERKPSNVSKNFIDTEKPNDISTKPSENKSIDEKVTSTLSPEEIAVQSSIPLDPAKMFFGSSANAQLIQFNMRPNVSQLVDLVVLAKEDAALQTGYLNFITSVEDTDPIIVHAEECPKIFTAEQPNSGESLREPLALSDPPIGLVIEEVTSSIGESLTKVDEENDETMPSKVISGSMDGDISNRSEVDEEQTGNDEVTKTEDFVESEKEKMEKTIENESESSMMNFPMSMEQSSNKEKELLGPESSVDSMECPDVQIQKKITSVSAESASSIQEPKELEEKIISPERDSLNCYETTEKKDKRDSMDSNIDDSLPSKLSFSMKVEDLLDLGSEDGIDLQNKKTFLEVTLKPTDLMKSMSLSQESQLAGERIESPITMIQIAPGSSESLKQELSENGDDEDKDNGAKIDSPNSAKSDKK